MVTGHTSRNGLNINLLLLLKDEHEYEVAAYPMPMSVNYRFMYYNVMVLQKQSLHLNQSYRNSHFVQIFILLFSRELIQIENSDNGYCRCTKAALTPSVLLFFCRMASISLLQLGFGYKYQIVNNVVCKHRIFLYMQVLLIGNINVNHI